MNALRQSRAAKAVAAMPILAREEGQEKSAVLIQIGVNRGAGKKKRHTNPNDDRMSHCRGWYRGGERISGRWW